MTNLADDRHANRKIAINPPVFFVSAGLILAFALFGALVPERASRVFTAGQALIVADFGWFYIAAVAGFLVFVLFLMFSRYGDVRLGPDDCEPEYGVLSWFAMLFSAGMGIGLIFFRVAEPVQHYATPPVGEDGKIDSARQGWCSRSPTGACTPGRSTSWSGWRWRTSRSGADCR